MRRRIVLTLAGAALFLAGYAMQDQDISPFAGMGDPRFLGLLLEGLGLLLLLAPLLGRRPPAPPPPRIRKELVRKPRGDDEDEAPGKPGPDR